MAEKISMTSIPPIFIKIVLNAVGTADDVDPKLRAFLDYVAGKSVDDEYVKKLDAAVMKAKANKEWRKECIRIICLEKYVLQTRYLL